MPSAGRSQDKQQKDEPESSLLTRVFSGRFRRPNQTSQNVIPVRPQSTQSDDGVSFLQKVVGYFPWRKNEDGSKYRDNPQYSNSLRSQGSVESAGSSSSSGSSQSSRILFSCAAKSTQASDEIEYKRSEEAEKIRLEEQINNLKRSPIVVLYNSNPQRYYKSLMDHYDKFTPELVDELVSRQSPYERRPTQIINIHYECYGIATLHALFACLPFEEYVKNKVPQNEFDHLVRLLYAQYKLGWDHIYITHILKSLGFKGSESQEDAEEFFTKFAEKYFDADFGSLNYMQTMQCCYCESTSETYHKNARLALDRKQSNYYYYEDINYLIKRTAKKVTLDLTCKYCGCGSSVQKLTYELPKVLFVSLTTLLMTSGLDNVSIDEVADFGPLTGTKEPKLYQLAAVVYYKKMSGETAHYFTRVHYGDRNFLVNDQWERIKENRSVSPSDGVPYFLIYYEKEKVQCESHC